MVTEYDYDLKSNLSFYKPRINCKIRRAKFVSSVKTAKNSFDIVHSDVCGKIDVHSTGGAKYFLALIDDTTCYVTKFFQWKTSVENSTGNKLKIRKWKRIYV